jgi:uncharacterized protein involved in response to NO
LHLGLIDAPGLARAPLLWHGHEMFFGFGWAVLGGFLLTATKNWVSIRGYHGPLLAFLAAAWVVERAGMWFGGTWPPALFELSNKLFLGSIVAMLLWTLIRYRHQDSYRDNYFFLLILPAFLVAKQLMLDSDHFRDGATMATGLFRVAFLVMLERTLSQFMKGVFQVEILRHAALDRSPSSCSDWRWWPRPGCRHRLRQPWPCCSPRCWRGDSCSGIPDWHCGGWTSASCISAMPASCSSCCSMHLAVAAAPAWVGAVSTHVFGLGVMGLIIPAMLIRIAKGHTGRKVVFDGGDKAVLWLMIAAFLLRVLAPQLDGGDYAMWLILAATGWLLGFGTLALRLTPLLLAPRVDGKAH